MTQSNRRKTGAPHSKMNTLKICHLNAQSIPAKLDNLLFEFRKKKCHIIGVSETFLKPNKHTNKSVEIPDYKIFRCDRKSRPGGGVALYVRKDLLRISKAKVISKNITNNLEHLALELNLNNNKIAICVGYMRVTGLPLDDLNEVVSQLCEDYDNVILIGDLNINFLDPSESRELRNVLNPLNLHCSQTSPTRYTQTSARLIDYIISNIPSKISNFFQSPLTDHDKIEADFNFDFELPPKYIIYRDFNQIDINALGNDIESTDWQEMFDSIDINFMLDSFYSKVFDLLDRHVPEKIKKITSYSIPWFKPDIKNKIQLKKMARRVWLNSGDENDKLVYEKYCKEVNKMIRSAKRAYSIQKLNFDLGTKVLWKNIANEGLKSKNEEELCNKFSANELNIEFTKVSVPPSIQPTSISSSTATAVNPNLPQFSFDAVSEEAAFRAIFSIKSNAIGSDGLPIKFLKISAPFLIRHITFIFNKIIELNTYPNIWKISKVVGLPKVTNPTSPSDIRPISLLPSLSKIFERLIFDQIKMYVDCCYLLSPFQSGFRTGYSTTTVLTHLTDFIRSSLDRGNCVLLTLLDFSKAFNSISFEIMDQKLKNIFKFSEAARSLISSYLCNRLQYVVVDDISSSLLPLSSGVPQGSILGPLIFSLYINDVNNSISNCYYHLYADDLQIFTEVVSNKHTDLISSFKSAVDLMNNDIESICNWAKTNNLHLNENKTQAILFSKKSHEINNFHNLPPIIVNFTTVIYQDTVKNLGILLNKHLDWSDQINKTSRTMLFGLRLLWRRVTDTPFKTRLLLVKTLILSHLFYCDVVFGDLNSSLNRTIQRIFNSCIRYVFSLKRNDRLSNYYSKILGCTLENYFKIRTLIFTYKIIKNHSPPYLHNNLIFSISSRTNNLIIPTHNSGIMSNSFAVRSSRLWNNIHNDIKNSSSVESFRNKLLKHFND